MEKSVSKISMNYFHTFFLIDLIPLIPLQYIEMIDARAKLFYMIKILRLEKGFRLLNISRFMRVINKTYFSYLELKFRENPSLAMSKAGEYQMSLTLITIQYVMKIAEMIIIIINTCYIIGILWFFICTLNEEFYQEALFLNMNE